jgi:hypothetical protein
VPHTSWANNMSMRRRASLAGVARPTQLRYGFYAERALGPRCAQVGLVGEFSPTCRASHHYSRTIDGMARDARNQARALARLGDDFPEHSPRVQSAQFTRYLPRYHHGLVNLCRLQCAAVATSAVPRAAVRDPAACTHPRRAGSQP